MESSSTPTENIFSNSCVCTLDLIGHIMVGQIAVQKSGKFPPPPSDFQEFVSNSGGEGFIMASFGSYVESILHKDKINMLATVFGKLKQRVLWRLKGDYVTILEGD